MNQLRPMAVFARIVESGSITAAADSLQLSKSVVSQHLKSLEKELGVTLLKRTTRRQNLTSAGEAFYQHCREINRLAEQAWQQAREEQEIPKGKLRITAPHALMGPLVAPTVATLIRRYPLLQPELISSDRHLDLAAENIDLAIRVGPSQDSRIRQRRIGQFRDVLCASQQLLSTEPLSQLDYIANTWQREQIDHQLVDEQGNPKHYHAQARCRADSFDACLALLESGAGIGLIPDFKLDQHRPRLAELFPGYRLPLNPVYALHTFERQLPLSVQLCIEEIAQRFDQG
ncbi:LysR family transcriptional regulator [Motiliproteus coralliicola]|uniref:LysR family transcriptional regulator n=1 Tax=Motiliproteus coralliicola TaxID=2283196 RepID=A0A369WDB9_9GAMM|nr:LysR substrate-binding domain-containing protein [Motiliproteus coralliicola]RDE19169.1 LysR family transcriptional regulator [Motiliproteus coralliicola]